MSDHHHDERVSVTSPRVPGCRSPLITRTRTILSPSVRRGAGMGRAYLDGEDERSEPQWDRLSDLIVDASVARGTADDPPLARSPDVTPKNRQVGAVLRSGT